MRRREIVVSRFTEFEDNLIPASADRDGIAELQDAEEFGESLTFSRAIDRIYSAIPNSSTRKSTVA